MQTKPYFALVEGFINGSYRKVGESVGELSEIEAKYLVLGGQISATAPAPKASAEKKGK